MTGQGSFADIASLPPAEFVEGVWRAWELAAHSRGTFDRDYIIGRRSVRLRCAGTSLLEQLTSSLAHLATERTSTDPELTIHLWDTVSSGVKMPFISLWNDCSERGAVRAFTSSSLSATRLTGADVCSLWDAERQVAMYWAHSAADIPSYERAAPFRGLLHAWWREHAGLLLHAGAVGNAQGGALLIGKGGVGKSTTALACMEAGLHYLSDDYCLLTHQPGLVVHSLYCSAKFHAADIQRFPYLQPFISNADELGDEKALCFLPPQSSRRLAPDMPVRVILLPRVTGLRETRLLPASAMDALQALAPSALIQLPDAGALELSHIRDVVTRVPCYWLAVGTDLQRIPEQVMEAIAHA